MGNRILGLMALGSFLLFFHNYGLTFLPANPFEISPARIRPFSKEKSFAYAVRFRHGEPDRWLSPRSGTRFFENDKEYRTRLPAPDEVQLAGGERWTHDSDRVVFATSDNTDPRTNGRQYTILSPVLYNHVVGGMSALVLAIAVAGLYWLNRRQAAPAPAPADSPRWRWHCAGAALLFVAGLYCNTGTLAPYANTGLHKVDPATGYLYNVDHPHFRVLYDFVNGADRPVWDGALMLRRILFPVLAWPFMRVAGFEVGGTLAALLLNLAGFLIFVSALRRRVGERGAIFAAWLLALYPGAAYWGGLPYPYALICPLSLLLMLGLLRLFEAENWRSVAGVSLAMGVAYLGYDLIVFFLPASLLLLAWRRRFGAAALSAGLQVLPLGLWVLWLAHGLHQPLDNSNAGLYRIILHSFLQIRDLGEWWSQVSYFADIGFDVHFGANFIFLPALFLALVGVNPLTSRIRLLPAEAALLAAGLALFLFNNLAQEYGGTWVMRGTWIARLYQPVFPAFILFAARWWQQLPPLEDWKRRLVHGGLAIVMAGNALIVFGPILNNPLRLSETAFYRFYNHIAAHGLYEHFLKEHGRRPLGFPRPQSVRLPTD